MKMNREIEFRGKTKPSDKCQDGIWVKGFLFIQEKKYFILYDFAGGFGNNRIKQVEVIPETVGQFVELKDHSNLCKKIFEKDIVEIIHPCWTNKAVCEFKNGSFIFRSIDKATQDVVVPGYTFMQEKWQIKVIGNTIDNPELLTN